MKTSVLFEALILGGVALPGSTARGQTPDARRDTEMVASIAGVPTGPEGVVPLVPLHEAARTFPALTRSVSVRLRRSRRSRSRAPTPLRSKKPCRDGCPAYRCGKAAAGWTENSIEALFVEDIRQYAYGTQTSNAMPLALGMVAPAYRDTVFAHLTRNVTYYGFPTTGGIGHRFLIRALAQEGRRDTSVLAFRKIIIDPNPVESVTWAEGAYDSIRGRIAARWQRSRDGFTLDVAIPAGATATVHVPAQSVAGVRESGTPARQAEAVEFLRMEDGRAVFAVGSGHYYFASQPSSTIL